MQVCIAAEGCLWGSPSRPWGPGSGLHIRKLTPPLGLVGAPLNTCVEVSNVETHGWFSDGNQGTHLPRGQGQTERGRGGRREPRGPCEPPKDIDIQQCSYGKRLNQIRFRPQSGSTRENQTSTASAGAGAPTSTSLSVSWTIVNLTGFGLQTRIMQPLLELVLVPSATCVFRPASWRARLPVSGRVLLGSLAHVPRGSRWE